MINDKLVKPIYNHNIVIIDATNRTILGFNILNKSIDTINTFQKLLDAINNLGTFVTFRLICTGSYFYNGVFSIPYHIAYGSGNNFMTINGQTINGADALLRIDGTITGLMVLDVVNEVK